MSTFVSLMYHNITAPESTTSHLSPSVTSYFVDQRNFAAHLDWLAEHGRCVRLADVRRMLSGKNGIAVPQSLPGVQITFDDGWRGAWELGGPLLEGHGFEAMLFITTGLIGRPDFLTRHELGSLPRGVFKIGSHAHSHRMLNELDDASLRDELTTSKHLLEDLTGADVDTLSLPGGAGDARVLRIAREVGYSFVFNSEVRLNSQHTPPLNIGRVPIKQDTSAIDVQRFIAHRLGGMRWKRGCLRVAKQILGTERYNRIRRRWLGEVAEQQDMLELAQQTCGHHKHESVDDCTNRRAFDAFV